jgi:hypothetical protein
VGRNGAGRKESLEGLSRARVRYTRAVLRLRAGGALALGLLALGCPLACGQAFSTASSSDAGADSTGGGDGTPGDQASADSSDGPAPGHVVYVSTAGSDSNDGTLASAPKKTIAQALQRAQSISPVEVHVCAGVYSESGLTLAQSIPLLGGYNCTTWTRTATYGYPTFDKANVTTIDNASPGVQAATLTIADGVTSSGKVDGFTITGASSFTGTTFGVQTMGSAAPLLSNDSIGGGGGTGSGTSPGSVGVVISSGSPEVAECIIQGGNGSGSVGSAGISISTSGTPNVHDDIVTGGSGSTTVSMNGIASLAVSVGSAVTGANALRSLAVFGTDPGVTAAGSSVGVLVTGTGFSADIQSCYIDGGSGNGSSTVSAGVELDTSGGTVNLLGDRIYGGARTGGTSSTIGVLVVTSGALDVENCEIHAGTLNAPATAGELSAGVQVAAATSPTFIDDTIYSGAYTGVGISVASGVTGVVVQDVLFAGGNPHNNSVAVGASSCSGQLAKLDHSAFVNLDYVYGCGSLTTLTSSFAVIGTLAGVSTTGDFLIPSPSGCDAGCISDGQCPGAPGTCLPSIFGASWTADDGVTGLLQGAPTGTDAGAMFEGWTLPASTFCALAHGGTPVSGITTDLFGQTRSTTAPTIGAFEDTASGCSP